ncbi:unnamed protein product [Diatraea saccharalis]|uniref:TRAF3-interacting protein 1 n=1 Tax=Diatraea saccharalis TaxID=40085 RepID=A0A9N9WCP8_9NEOP|nr:unnamed protein product [Diatraea saccharalis]
MEKELDPTVIKATQSSLGKYVKRPPLSEKLLKKPPFRFLHDIVTCVLKTTGFFAGLFEEEELISDNVKDRESKILFLNKVIAVVGQEPEKTNELLQYLAQALDKKLSSTDAVQKYKESINLSIKTDDTKSKQLAKPAKKINETNKLTSKSNEKLTSKKVPNVRISKKNETDKPNTNKSKSRDKSINITESPPKKVAEKFISKKPSVEKKAHESKDSSGELIDISENKKVNHPNEDETITKIPKDHELERNSITNVDPIILTESREQNPNSSYTVADNLNSSTSSQDFMEKESEKNDGDLGNINSYNINADELSLDYNDLKIKENVTSLDVTSDPLISGNMQKNDDIVVKDTVTEIKTGTKDEDVIKHGSTEEIIPTNQKNNVRPISVRPSSSRPGAPRLRDKFDNIPSEIENTLVGKVNIIVENVANEDEEDTSIMIVDQEVNSLQIAQEDQEQLQTSLNQHGHLVQQILDSQKQYSQLSGKTEIEWEFGAQKARDTLHKEVEQFRFNIQALSRIANPLGKLLDHIQEDVEVMRQELQQWTKTYEEASKELSKQKAANEESLFPLTTKAKQLNADILEKHDKINDLKVVIHKNSNRIEKLLANGNVQ